MRGSPVFMLNFIQICLYIIEKILENRQKRPNLGTRPVSKNILQKWPFLSVMQSHLIKMYIYHTKYLIFNISSWAKLKWVVLRLLSWTFCCYNHVNRYNITDFMSKIKSAKVWLNLAKSSLKLAQNTSYEK